MSLHFSRAILMKHTTYGTGMSKRTSLIALLDFVYDRAEPEVEELLKSTQQAVNEGANGILRVTWARIQLDNWEMAAPFHCPRPGKKYRYNWFLREVPRGSRNIGVDTSARWTRGKK